MSSSMPGRLARPDVAPLGRASESEPPACLNLTALSHNSATISCRKSLQKIHRINPSCCTLYSVSVPAVLETCLQARHCKTTILLIPSMLKYYAMQAAVGLKACRQSEVVRIAAVLGLSNLSKGCATQTQLHKSIPAFCSLHTLQHGRIMCSKACSKPCCLEYAHTALLLCVDGRVRTGCSRKKKSAVLT